MKKTFVEYCNEPAFSIPIYGVEANNQQGAKTIHFEVSPIKGLTRLEFFTAIAMQGLITAKAPIDDLLPMVAGQIATKQLHELYKFIYPE